MRLAALLLLCCSCSIAEAWDAVDEPLYIGAAGAGGAFLGGPVGAGAAGGAAAAALETMEAEEATVDAEAATAALRKEWRDFTMEVFKEASQPIQDNIAANTAAHRLAMEQAAEDARVEREAVAAAAAIAKTNERGWAEELVSKAVTGVLWVVGIGASILLAFYLLKQYLSHRRTARRMLEWGDRVIEKVKNDKTEIP